MSRKAITCYALSVVVMSLADALLTIDILRQGGSELNPCMDLYLQYSEGLFLASKMGLTIAGIVCLVMVAHKFPIARVGLKGTVVMYIILLTYHAYGRFVLGG